MSAEVQKKGRRITIDLSNAATEEVDRLKNITGNTTAELFRYALNLLRIYVKETGEGKQICVVDPKEKEQSKQLVLPLSN